jgi:hypothetical protein
MKLSRLKRPIILALACFLIFFTLSLFWIDFEMNDFDIYSLIPRAAIILFALYVILYKKTWSTFPAKITFLALFFSQSMVLSFGYYFSYTDLIFFLLLAILLVYLYKNDLKKWIISLKNEPLYVIKKKSEISNWNIILIILGGIIILASEIYTFWFFSWVVFVNFLLLFLYLIFKKSPLKSAIRVYFIFWGILSFYSTFKLLQSGGLYNIKYMGESNSLAEGLMVYIKRLIFPIFAILLVHNTKLKKILDKNINKSKDNK